MILIKNKKAFTFVELIVASVILIILSSVGFYSYTSLLGDSRDSQRKSDLASLKTAFKTYHKKRGFYPLPGNSFNIVYQGGLIIAKQGELSKDVILSSIDEVPYDPYTKTPYSYSITNSKQEFQVGLTMENADTPIALLVGDYKTVRKDIIPTIMLALNGSGSDVEIDAGTGTGSINRQAFIFDKGAHNLPYELVSPYLPYTDGTAFTGIIDDPSIDFWQNSDYRSCEEIKDDLKNTGNGTYQLMNNTGVLVDFSCTF